MKSDSRTNRQEMIKNDGVYKLADNWFYYIVESKILKMHSKIFSISSLVKISIT